MLALLFQYRHFNTFNAKNTGHSSCHHKELTSEQKENQVSQKSIAAEPCRCPVIVYADTSSGIAEEKAF
jgi:hypothetical protein